MTEFLFFVVVLVVIWIARSAAMRARTTESLVTKLTSRVFNLEEELKQLRKLSPSERAEKQHAPMMSEAVVESPPVEIGRASCRERV